MHRTFLFPILSILTFSFLFSCAATIEPGPPPPAPVWKDLFDGKTTKGWRGFQKETFPEKGWVVEDGCLRVKAGGGGGDIITTEKYQDFDLRLEFKVAEKANSGIMFRVTEDGKAPWHTGPEFQIFDDLGHNVEPTSMQSSGALYALYAPPSHKPVKAAGEWNQARIVIQGERVQHWLNGVQLVDCDLSSEDYMERLNKSKFAVYQQFGRNKMGHLALQDHGNDVWFRNIKIRDLTPDPVKKEEVLFNGKDLTGWSFHLEDGGKMEDTWHVAKGILICKGNPAGYIYTEKDYKNFILKLKWRFSPVTRKAGNSGVLLRQTGEHKVWPRSLEAQLQSGSAGDFWVIDGFPVKTAAERTSGRNAKKTHGNENPVGEWNEYEIIVKGGHVVLIVNGEELNRATEAEVIPGRICLQSEGAEIHFQDICLTPLDE